MLRCVRHVAPRAVPIFSAPARLYTPTVTGADFAASHKAPQRPINVLFFGTSEFAVPIVESLAAAREGPSPLVGNLEVVVPAKRTQSKSGQDVPVVSAARALDLPLHYVDRGTNFRLEGWELPEGDFDIGVTASFGHMFPQRMIDRFSMGMINAHGSLLPKLRGAAPIQRALLLGETETGVTTTTLEAARIDTGRVLLSTPSTIEPTDTYPDLVAKLALIAAKDTVRVLQEWDALAAASKEQGELEAVAGPVPEPLRRARKLGQDFGTVAWGSQSAAEVSRLWRAVATYRPVSTSLSGRRVLLSGVALVAETHAAARDIAAAGPSAAATAAGGRSAATAIAALFTEGRGPGAMEFTAEPLAGEPAEGQPPGALLVRCAEGVVAVKELQYECKPVTTAAKFAMGLGIMKGKRAEGFEPALPEAAPAV